MTNAQQQIDDLRLYVVVHRIALEPGLILRVREDELELVEHQVGLGNLFRVNMEREAAVLSRTIAGGGSTVSVDHSRASRYLCRPRKHTRARTAGPRRRVGVQAEVGGT